MHTAYLNIGSNKGDRHALIERAVALICAAYPQATLRRAPYVESEPWGYTSAHPYINLGVALDFDNQPDPLRMLHRLQQIERSISSMPHRNADGTYRDREVDIDMIAIDSLRLDTPELTLPHPRAAERPFVTGPLRQLGYDLRQLRQPGQG